MRWMNGGHTVPARRSCRVEQNLHLPRRILHLSCRPSQAVKPFGRGALGGVVSTQSSQPIKESLWALTTRLIY